MSVTRSELEKKARRAVRQHAFFRLESALVLAGTIVLTVLLPRPFSGWPWWGWPLLGLIGFVALFYSSLSDAETNARILLEFYRQQFDPERIHDQALRQEVEVTLEYQRCIEEQMHGQRRGELRDWLAYAANQFSEWTGSIYQLALRLDAYKRGELLARERESAPRQIEELAARRRLERDPVIRRELDAALEAMGKQWQSLRDLDAQIKQAEADLKASTAALASIYSQVELMDDGDVRSGQADLLEADVLKQVNDLDDLISRITRQCQGISNVVSSANFV